MTDSIVYTIGYVMIIVGFVVGFASFLAFLAEVMFQRIQQIHGLIKIKKALQLYEKMEKGSK